jgi:glycosyltransferase involved in cell wall biosynthesis
MSPFVNSAARHTPPVASGTTTGPLVSICIAVFNAERFLAEALRSVLNQTYANLEICVVDDGSTDRSYEIISSISDPRLRVFRTSPNRGGYAAMNHAATHAHGEFVAFYHADDVYDPTIIEKQVAFLRAHAGIGAVFTRDHNIDEAGRVTRTVKWPRDLPRNAPLDLPTVLRGLVRGRNPFCCPTFMTRRSALETVGAFDHARWGIAADLDMWIRLAAWRPLAILDEPLVSYRKGEHQWTARDRRLRTEPDPFFAIVDEALHRHGSQIALAPSDLTEYAWHRCGDHTARAANCIIRGEDARAACLLDEAPYPWRALLVPGRRRKLRLLMLRTLMASGLAVRARAPLAAMLRRLGP